MRVMMRDICSAVSTTVSLDGLGSGIKNSATVFACGVRQRYTPFPSLGTWIKGLGVL